jgi:hypothetical protein
MVRKLGGFNQETISFRSAMHRGQWVGGLHGALRGGVPSGPAASLPFDEGLEDFLYVLVIVMFCM